VTTDAAEGPPATKAAALGPRAGVPGSSVLGSSVAGSSVAGSSVAGPP